MSKWRAKWLSVAKLLFDLRLSKPDRGACPCVARRDQHLVALTDNSRQGLTLFTDDSVALPAGIIL